MPCGFCATAPTPRPKQQQKTMQAMGIRMTAKMFGQGKSDAAALRMDCVKRAGNWVACVGWFWYICDNQNKNTLCVEFAALRSSSLHRCCQSGKDRVQAKKSPMLPADHQAAVRRVLALGRSGEPTVLPERIGMWSAVSKTDTTGGSCKTPCGTGILPVIHGRDAHATLETGGFCKSLNRSVKT